MKKHIRHDFYIQTKKHIWHDKHIRQGKFYIQMNIFGMTNSIFKFEHGDFRPPRMWCALHGNFQRCPVVCIWYLTENCEWPDNVRWWKEDITGFAWFVTSLVPRLRGRRCSLGTRLDSYELQLELTYHELIAMGLLWEALSIAQSILERRGIFVVDEELIGRPRFDAIN